MKDYNEMIDNLVALTNDSLKNKVALFNENASKFTDQAIREGFLEMFGVAEINKNNWYQICRNYENEILTYAENVLKVNLPGAWENSRFYDQFVEIKRGDLGEENEFTVEADGTLVAATFSGNHWDVPRHKIQGTRSFSVPTSWIVIRVYNELESFLLGNDTLVDMIKKIQKALQDNIDSRIFSAFNGVGTYLPASFKETGSYDVDTMNKLIEKVQTYAQKEVVIAGTRTGLAHITNGMNTAWIANSQKEELATTGMVIENIGLPAKAIMIPQTFVRGTYDFKVSNNTIHVLPADSKIIKMYYEGNVRSRFLTSQDTHDQTYDNQTQVKVGIGIVCDNITGRYDIV